MSTRGLAARISRRLDRLNLARLLERIISSYSFLPRVVMRSGWAPQPLHFLLETTYGCNLRCSFCQYLDIIEGSSRTVGPVRRHSPDDIRRAIAGLKPGRLITFSGGEVFTQRHFIDLLEEACARHRVHVITNGTYLDEATVSRMMRLAPKRFWQRGLVLVDLSLQGGPHTHDEIVGRPGSFERSAEGLRMLLEQRAALGLSSPKVNLKMVVTEHTVDEIVEYVQWGTSLGVDVVSLMALHNVIPHSGELVGGSGLENLMETPPTPTGVDPEHLRAQLIRAYQVVEGAHTQIRTSPQNLPIDEFVRLYTDDDLDPETFKCRSPWYAVQLTAEGRFSVCPYSRIGDSNSQSIKDVWNGPEFQEFRRGLRSAEIFPGCRGCCSMQYHGGVPEGLAGVDAADIMAVRDRSGAVIGAQSRAGDVPAVPVMLTQKSG